MKKTLSLLLLLSLTEGCASATRIRRDPTVHDCALARPAFDNPFSDTAGWTMRRYQWHIMYAGLTTGAAVGIHKATGLSPAKSAALATIAVGFVPHIRGYARGSYGINIGDWIADGWMRSAPAWFVLGHSDGGDETKTHLLAASSYLLGYAATACYASP